MTFWAWLVGVVSFNGILNGPSWGIFDKHGWPTMASIAAQAGIGLSFLIAWFAWIGWGRQRFPLAAAAVRQVDRRRYVGPATRMQSDLGKIVFWACTIAAFFLLFIVAWLDWSTVATLLAWTLIGAIYNWIAWIFRQPPDKTGNDPSDPQRTSS